MRQPSNRTTTRRHARTRPTAAAPGNAIALLKADHRQVEEWFEQFEDSKSANKKADLARQICQALRIHTTIEEEIFYPAFLQATEDKDLHHEAEIEHAAAKNLIAQIEDSGPEDDYFDSKVKVLSEMIKHHVKEEEQPGGMFAEAKKSGMDLDDLGLHMQARREALESDGATTQHRPH